MRSHVRTLIIGQVPKPIGRSTFLRPKSILTKQGTYCQHPEYAPRVPVVVISEWDVLNRGYFLRQKSLHVLVKPGLPVMTNGIDLSRYM